MFKTPLPEGEPEACLVMIDGDTFEIPIGEGLYYVLAAGAPAGASPESLFGSSVMLRARAGPVRVKAGVPAHVVVSLRFAHVTDPPMLISLPWAIMRRLHLNGGVH